MALLLEQQRFSWWFWVLGVIPKFHFLNSSFWKNQRFTQQYRPLSIGTLKIRKNWKFIQKYFFDKVIDFPVRYFWMMILFQGKNTNLIICGVLRIEMFFKKCGSSLRKNVDFQMYFLWNSCKNRGFEWFLFYKVEILAKTVLKVPETESKK